MNDGVPKGTSHAKVTLYSKKIEPITFEIVKLHFSEGINRLLGKKTIFFKIP